MQKFASMRKLQPAKLHCRKVTRLLSCMMAIPKTQIRSLNLPRPKKDRRQQETDAAAQLKLNGQAYWSLNVTHEGPLLQRTPAELRGPSDFEAVTKDASKTLTAEGSRGMVGIAWFIFMLLADPIVRVAEEDGRILICSIPGKDYLFTAAGKATVLRPPAHLIAPQPPHVTWDSYRVADGDSIELDGAASQRYSILNQVFEKPDKRFRVRAVYFGGGGAARSDLALLLGFDFCEQSWRSLPVMTAFPIDNIRVYNIARHSSSGVCEVTPLGHKHASRLPLVLVEALLDKTGHLSLPESVRLASQRWRVESLMGSVQSWSISPA